MSGTSDSKNNIALQPRDLDILRGLFESRVMSQEHITRIYFAGKSEASKKRLQRLKAAKLIAERPRKTYEPAVLYLSKAGFVELIRAGRLLDYPKFTWESLEKRVQVSSLTIRHELEVMDVRTVLSEHLEPHPDFSLIEFSTWPLLFQFHAQKRPRAGQPFRGSGLLKPDGYLRVHRTRADGGYDELFYFLEVDRSTESQETLADKAHSYRDFYQQGGLAVRYGKSKDDYRTYAFRVLMVFQNDERRNNAAETMLRMDTPVLSQVWLTTRSELLADPFGAIWFSPRDYRDVTSDTEYDPLKRTVAPYRRQPDREAFVEAHIAKRSAFL
jgi:hypothetical protein